MCRLSVLAAALLLSPLAACATDDACCAGGHGAEHPALSMGEAPRGGGCAVRGGTLALIDAATGAPIACRPVHLEAGGERFEGSSDARGLVSFEAAAGSKLRYSIEGFGEGEAGVAAPFGPEVPLVEVWRGEAKPLVRVLAADEGIALANVEVSFQRGGMRVYAGRSNAVGALVGTPVDVAGAEVKVVGFRVARFDAASRTLLVVAGASDD